jgi:hypothetical protein
MQLLVLVVLSSLVLASALLSGSRIAQKVGIREARRDHARRLHAWDPANDKLDSSEIETGSSTSVREKKRAASLIAEAAETKTRDALLAKARALHEGLQLADKAKSSNRDIFAAAEQQVKPKEAAPIASSSPSKASAVPAAATGGISTAQGFAGQTFDAGLIIAFPVIVGTLALFFIFPLIKDQIAAGLPPVPL